MKMKALCCWTELTVLILIFKICFNATYQLTKLQVCSLCGGTIHNNTMVDQICSASAGRIDGRCCVNNNTDDPEHIIGLDLSNCSLNHVGDLQEASTALIIDLSLNPIVNFSEAVFQGFRDLSYLILPKDLGCPGGQASWQKIEFKDGNCHCEGQINMCNQTGQLSMNCPENSLCAPFGPGFYECSCAENFYGYKCLREGEFPVLRVFGPLAASTVLISFLLWATQRRKTKSV